MVLSQKIQDIFSTRWKKTLILMFFAHLVSSMGFSSIFPFLPLYVKELGTDTNFSIEFLSGLVFASQGVTMMIASPIWGSLADRMGRKLMVVRSMYGAAIITLLMAFVGRAEDLVLLRAIQGTITGTIAAGSALVAAESPRERTGFALGMIQTALGLGNALGPILGGIIADLLGYHEVFYITAGLLMTAGLIVTFGIQETFQPVRKDRSRPRMLDNWKKILSTTGIKAAYALRFISALASTTLVPVAPLFVQMLLVSSTGLNTITGLVTGVASTTMTLSAVYLGQVGDRIGHRKILIWSSVAAVILFILQALVQDVWQLLFLQALVGVTGGGIIPSVSALLTKSSKHGDEGTVFGLDNSITSAARAIGPMIGAGIAAALNLRFAFLSISVLYGLMLITTVKFIHESKTDNSQPE